MPGKSCCCRSFRRWPGRLRFCSAVGRARRWPGRRCLSQSPGRQHDRHDRASGRARPAAGGGGDDRVRQPRLDRADVLARLAERHAVRAGPAGGERRGDGGRLRPSNGTPVLRQPALRGGGGPRAWQPVHRVPERHAHGRHRRAAGTQPAAAGALPVRRARDGVPPSLREMGGRAGAGGGRAGRGGARLRSREDTAVWADLRVHPRGRLAQALRAHCCPADQHPCQAGPGGAGGARRGAGRRAPTRPGDGAGSGSGRRLGRRGGAGRAAARPVLQQPEQPPRELSRGPPPVCWVPARSAGTAVADARRLRPHRGVRRARVHLPRRGALHPLRSRRPGNLASHH